MKPRYRLSAKQTAKNKWQFDGTVEVYENPYTVLYKPRDVSNQKKETVGQKLLEMIKDAENAFRADGKQLVSDEVSAPAAR